MPAAGPPLLSLMGRGCAILESAVPIPAPRAAAMLPTGYTPLADAAGQATVVVTTRHCTSLVAETANGMEAPDDATWGDVGILVEPVGAPGLDAYVLWGTTGSPSLAGHLEGAGFNTTLGPANLTGFATSAATWLWRATLDAQPGNATADAPFQGNLPVSPLPVHPQRAWHNRGSRVASLDYGAAVLLAAGATTVGTVVAPPQSRLAALLGGPGAVGPTSLLFMEVDARLGP
jgi:hypothetical protein